MKILSGFEFPETNDETWEPTFRRHPLHRQVLVVAKTRAEGTWKAYCFPVPGINHNDEMYLWEKEGSQLPEAIARSLFSEFEGLPYAR